MGIWETLSKIDCNAHVEKKGRFSYLAWTWAWAMVKERYPLARYTLEPDVKYPDGTMEVRCSVTIEDLSHTMWLPVINANNKAIANPNAFDVNSSRMRCLVKCLAMFGLGHYIYAGESVPQQESEPEPAEPYTIEQLAKFKTFIANSDGWGLKDFCNSVGTPALDGLFNAFRKGEVSKTKELCRKLINEANTELKATLAYIRECIANNQLSSVEEALAERDDTQRKLIWAGLTEIEQMQIQNLRDLAN
jgi:hypothetical protein